MSEEMKEGLAWSRDWRPAMLSPRCWNGSLPRAAYLYIFFSARTYKKKRAQPDATWLITPYQPRSKAVFNFSISEYSGKSARLLCGDKDISGASWGWRESTRKVEDWEDVGIKVFMTKGCGQPYPVCYICN